jgi:hypothetical protein
LLEEHLRVQGRTKWYEALEEMQKDLDAYLVSYNTKRPGRTPYRCSRSVRQTKKVATQPPEKEVKKAA